VSNHGYSFNEKRANEAIYRLYCLLCDLLGKEVCSQMGFSSNYDDVVLWHKCKGRAK